MGIRLRPGHRPRLRRRAGWLLGASGALVVALGSAVVYQLTSGTQQAGGEPATVRVQRGTVSAAVAAAGTLQPAQTRGLAFSMDGTVTEVRVRPGDQVSAGQVLARIDDTDAKERVSSAQDALDAAQESLDQAQQAASGAGSGSAAGCLTAAGLWLASPGPVRSGLASPSPVSLTKPPASPSGSPSPSASPSGSASAPPAPPPSTTPGHPAPPAPSGPPRQGGSQPGQPGQLGPNEEQSGQHGRPGAASCTAGTAADGGGGTGTDRVLGAEQQVNSAELQLETAEQELAGTTITAPIAGKVLSVAGDVGSRASAGGTGFIVLGDVADMQVKADFPEADASGLKVGQQATVILADRPGTPLPAKVTQVDPVGTVSGQMVRFGVLLAFDKVPDNLLNGQSANVRVETGSVPGVLYLPASAVHDIAGGAGTVLVRTGQTTQRRQVQVGLQGDQYTEIRSGLAQGDEVLAAW